MSAIIELSPIKAAIMTALSNSDRLLSAAEIFERCDEIETIAAVHTALHVLHRRGLVLREESTEKGKNGKPFYLYCPATYALLRRNPDPAPAAPDLDFVPLVDYLAAELKPEAQETGPVVDAEYDGLDFEPYPEEKTAPPGLEPRASDPVLDAIDALRERLVGPVWTDDDIRRMQALADVLAPDSDDFLCEWLDSVTTRMRGEAAA